MGSISPVTRGRFRVRFMMASMSRSTYMLMAFAPPAANVPPRTVATMSHTDGMPLVGHHHRRHGRDEQELDDAGLRQGHVAPEAAP